MPPTPRANMHIVEHPHPHSGQLHPQVARGNAQGLVLRCEVQGPAQVQKLVSQVAEHNRLKTLAGEDALASSGYDGVTRCVWLDMPLGGGHGQGSYLPCQPMQKVGCEIHNALNR